MSTNRNASDFKRVNIGCANEIFNTSVVWSITVDFVHCWHEAVNLLRFDLVFGSDSAILTATNETVVFFCNQGQRKKNSSRLFYKKQ